MHANAVTSRAGTMTLSVILLVLIAALTLLTQSLFMGIGLEVSGSEHSIKARIWRGNVNTMRLTTRPTARDHDANSLLHFDIGQRTYQVFWLHTKSDLEYFSRNRLLHFGSQSEFYYRDFQSLIAVLVFTVLSLITWCGCITWSRLRTATRNRRVISSGHPETHRSTSPTN